jgi:hypothetical protein
MGVAFREAVIGRSFDIVTSLPFEAPPQCSGATPVCDFVEISLLPQRDNPAFL